MPLEGNFSVELTPEQLIELFARKPLWDREEFRRKHFLSYHAGPGEDAATFVEAAMLHDGAINAHEKGNFGEAIELEALAVTKFPGFVEAHLQIACDYWELNRFSDALMALDRMRQFSQEEVPDFHFFRAMSLMNLDRLDDAITEAQKEAAVIGPDAEVLSLLATLYQQKFVLVLDRQIKQQVPRIGECWLVCLWRFYQLQPNDEVEAKIAELSKHPSHERLPKLGIPPWRCAFCEFPTHLGAVPVLEKMLISQGHRVFVCDKCVARRQIPVDKRFPQQHRIWVDGEKFLQFGNVFVNV